MSKEPITYTTIAMLDENFQLINSEMQRRREDFTAFAAPFFCCF